MSERLIWVSGEALAGIERVSRRADAHGKGTVDLRKAVEAAIEEWVQSKEKWLDVLDEVQGEPVS